jgi:hypothetical protein
MRRTKSILASGVFSMLVLGVVIAPAPAPAGGNCMAKLVGSAAVAPGFDCNVKFSNEPSQPECWSFFQEGSLSQFFNLFTESLNNGPADQLSPEYGCACDTTGSFKSPLFNNSPNEFECDDDEGHQLQGKVKGHKLSGQGSDDEGNAVIFSCTPNTGCG